MQKHYFKGISNYFYFYVIVSVILFWVLISSGSGGDFGSGILEAFIWIIYLAVLNIIFGYMVKKHVQPRFKRSIVRDSFFLMYSTFYGVVILTSIIVYLSKQGFEDFGLVIGGLVGTYFVFMLLSGSFYAIGTLFVRNKKKK